HGGIAKIFEAQLLEIVAPDIDVEILAPIILHPLVDHGAAGNEVLDAVGAVAERRLERSRTDVAFPARCIGSPPPMLRQHVELPDDERQLAISGAVENERDLALAGLLDLDDVTIVSGMARAVFLEGLHGENDIFDRDRLAVVVTRIGAQTKRRR